MKKSVEKILSDHSSETDLLFSFKRYFINNLDSYHGEYVLQEVTKVLEHNVNNQAKQPSQASVAGEDGGYLPPPPLEQPYEIIGKSFI